MYSKSNIDQSWKILNNLEIVKRETCLGFSKPSIFFIVVAETQLAIEKRINKIRWLCLCFGAMLILPNEQSEWVYQIVRYVHSPALFIQRDSMAAFHKSDEKNLAGTSPKRF